MGLFQWNGTTYAAAPSQASLTYAYDATGATIRVSAADLGKTKSIGFVVEAVSGIGTDANGDPDFTNAHGDVAPDPGHGLFSYSVLTTLTLRQTAFTTAPRPAKPGARFSASLGVSESDTGGPISKATIACAGTVAGKRVAATHSLVNGIATCSWKLPKTAAGKRFTGTIAVTVQGATLKKTFSTKVAKK